VHSLRRLTLAALFFLSPALAAQDEAWYQVELLVFDRNDLRPGLESEHWPLDPGWPALAQALDLLPPAEEAADGERGYPSVDALYHRLGDLEERLARHPGHRLLAHLAWTQSAPPRTATLPALVTDPDDPERYQPLTYLPPYQDAPPVAAAEAPPAAPAPFGQDEILVEPLPAPEALPPATLPPQPAEPPAQEASAPAGIHLVSSMGPPQRRLFGTVRLRRGRYLHLDLDLVLRPEPERLPAPPDAPAALEAPPSSPPPDTGQAPEALPTPPDYSAVEGFRLRQSRRIRPGEIHYFDHPLYGVVAVVHKVEPPTATPPSSTDTP